MIYFTHTYSPSSSFSTEAKRSLTEDQDVWAYVQDIWASNPPEVSDDVVVGPGLLHLNLSRWALHLLAKPLKVGF